jgi:hypothetical protein
MDRVLDFGLPGLVFLVLVIWLVRKVVRAARTERDLEGERLTGAFADELRAGKALASAHRAPHLVKSEPEDATTASEIASTPPHAASPPVVPLAPHLVTSASQQPLRPLDGADVEGALPEHLRIVNALAREREATMLETEGDVDRRLEVLWVKSTATHVVWCERRHPATRAAAGMVREVVCVARIADGKAVERWTY